MPDVALAPDGPGSRAVVAAAGMTGSGVPPTPALDPWRPHGVVMEPERAADGSVLSTLTIFLTGARCPWHCVMCDLWQYTTDSPTPRGAIPHQIRLALDESRQRGLDQPDLLKLYNAGSWFDRRAVPVDDEDAVVQAVAGIPRVVVESHPALIGDRAWHFRDALERQTPDARLEVAMGLETASPDALAAIDKGITLESFAAAALALRAHDIDLRVFLLIDPPFVPEDEQDLWLERSVAFAAACGATAITLIPTRLGTPPLDAMAADGRFASPALSRIENVAERALVIAAGSASTRGDGGQAPRVFADIWDLERFATCPSCLDARRERLSQMNLTQAAAAVVTCHTCEATRS